MKNEQNFEIKLLKEVYQKKTKDECYMHPYREYNLRCSDEVYILKIDDRISGNSIGLYVVKLYKIETVEKLIYKYEYELKGRKPYIFIYVDSDYSDIIGILEEKEIIKRY